GRDTLVFTGPERLSKEYDIPVVMGRIIREKRGRYSVEFEVLTMDPRSTAEGEITVRSNRDVEALIRKYPEQWLWSHKRWKHTRNGE
ncbi:MAG: lysophospholipid acyltransferase family protein, partial [Flavobacteriales bacterium]|nr:lysophospholipid acyltransferase family protein [Flavobacteriales bacterium]